MAAKKWRENDFWQNIADDTVYTLQVKNYIEMAVSCTVSEINMFCILCRNSIWPPKMAGKLFFWQKVEDNSTHTLWVKNFIEIALSRTICEMNAFLTFFITVKFRKLLLLT